ncbi:MAG: TRIC cation channel family protein [Desulfovibrionaceae bacterium]|nr:TRIC cation channel family protein [Desulfovibrionaceae bacterium]
MTRLLFCDMAASAMLAACVVYRARQYEHPVAGAVLLACFVGLASPSLRDVLLGQGLPLTGGMLCAVALGAAGGALCARFLGYRFPFFFLSDSLSASLTAGTACAKALLCGLEPLAAALLGLLVGLCGGLVRDVALGDTAHCLDSADFGLALAFGLAVQVLVSYAFWIFPLWSMVAAGCLCCMGVRLFVRYRA